MCPVLLEGFSNLLRGAGMTHLSSGGTARGTTWFDRVAKWSGRCPGAASAAYVAPAKGARERSGRSAHRAARPSSAVAQPLAADSVESRPATTRFSVPMRQPRSSPVVAATPAQRLPGAVSSLRLACLTCLLGALTVSPAVLAQQTGDIDLVFNDHEGLLHDLLIQEDYRTVQSFSTGSNANGYLLSGVNLWLRNIGPGASPVVTIHQQTTAGPPGPLLYTLTNPATLVAEASNTFTAPENAFLHADSGYSVQVWTSAGKFRLAKVLSNAQMGEEGWRISNQGKRFSSADGMTWASGDSVPGVQAMRITGRHNETLATAVGSELTSTGSYHTDDVIEATVSFSDIVAVDGIPVLALQIGDNSRDAAYVSGSGTSKLVFHYTVVDGDYDEDGVSILPGLLSLPTGASITTQSSNTDAVLTLPLLSDQQLHRVNTGPAIRRNGIRFTSTPVAETHTNSATYGLGEPIEITVEFDVPVIVDTTGGIPTIVMTMGTYGAGYEPRTATYARGSGSADLVFVYVVQSGDRDTDGVSVSANQLELNSSTIRDDVGRDALLVHRRKNGGFHHKVDAELATAIATLANLALSHGILTPAFDAANTSYTATVSNDIEVTTVTASAASDATTSILPADADTNTDGHQVSLREGNNLIAVTVSMTGAADRTYTVTVARGGPPVFTTLPTFSVEENRFFRGEVTAQDLSVNDSVSGYEITGGADRQLFGVAQGTGRLKFKDAPDGANFEDPQDADRDNVYELEVTATSVNQTDATEETATQEITVTVLDVEEQPARPAEPVVEVASGSATSLDVRWQAPETNGGPDLIGYEVQYREYGSGGWTGWTHTGTGTNTTIAGVLADTTHEVQVRALNGETPSDWSPPGRGPKTVPGPPADLTAPASGRTGIDLAWTAPTDDGGTAITGYRIEVSSDGGANWSDLVADTGAMDTTHEHTGLLASATRHYRVSALNAIGEGSPSGAAQATTELAEVFLGSFDSALDEGSATVPVKVKLSHPSEGTVTVDYATSDGGGNGAAASSSGDYVETSGTLAIPTETTEAGFDIPIEDDALWEHEESFTVTLSNAAGATLGPSEQLVAIADNDPPPTVSFRQAQYEVTEGTDANVDLIIDKDALAGREVTIDFDFDVEDDTADVLVDYEPPGDYTLTLAAEELETSLRIAIIDDEDVEPSERFSVILNDLANTGIQFTDRVTIVTIKSEDTVVPDAPTSLTATLTASDDVELAWGAPDGYYGEGAEVTGYRIEATSDGGANWDVVTANTGSIATSYTDVDTPAPAMGAGLHYRVSAINSAGVGPASNEALIGEGRADATLSNLTLSGVTLEQGFAPAKTEYTASVLHAVSRITVTPSLNHANARVAYVDTTDADLGAGGHQVDLVVGDNVITVTVTAEDGSTTQSYTVTVTRAGSADATLSNLTLSGVTLEQGFAPAKTEYTASVLHAVSRITVTPTPNHANAQVAYVDTTDADLGAGGHQVDLVVGDNVITVTVTAEDNSTTQDYTLTVTRNTASESQAAGAPTITGTAQVDEKLRVDTSDITDGDGLNNVSYSYQWIRVDGSNETDIAGANKANYEPVAADLGKSLKVRVSFNDDNGNGEELTSAATTPVVPPTPATASQSVEDLPPGFIYAPGSTLEVHVLFNKAVDVTGEPRVKIGLDVSGPGTRYLYVPFVASESSSMNLVFIYEVTGEHDSADMSLLRNGLELNGGSIRNAGTQVDAILTTSGTLIGYLRTRWVEDIEVTSSPAVSWSPSTYGPGETVEFTATFGGTVTLDTTGGQPRLWLSFVSGIQFAEYAGGSGSNALMFAWTVPETGFSELASFSLQGNVMPGTSAFRNESGLDLNGATIADAEGRPVNVRHGDFSSPSWVDTLPPVLLGSADGATVDGSEVGLTYRVGENDADSEPLAPDSTPVPGDFAVTVTDSDGVSTTHAVSRVNVTRDVATVTLTLAAPVSSRDVVTLDYTPGTNPIKDLWGNEAVALHDRAVRNDTPTSTDATLSALALSDGTLTPAFASGTFAYTAEVANSVSQVTLTAMTTDDGASVSAVTLDGAAITNNDFTDGITVPLLLVGDNAIVVTVTAENGTTQTYTVTVTRAPAVAGTCSADKDWCSKLTVGFAQVGNLKLFGFAPDVPDGTLADTTIQYGGKTWTVSRMVIHDDSPAEITVQATLDAFVPRGSVFDLGGTTFTADATSEQSTTGLYSWLSPGGNFGWVLGQDVMVSVGLGNFAATGAPGISGTAQVGQVLTATTSGISDTDGKTKAEADNTGYAYAYQWVRVQNLVETEISGATASTHKLTASDEGETVEVKVSFTDDAGNSETLTSDATAAVRAASTDTTLSALALSDGTLTPAFASGTFAYTAEVANSVSQVTLTAMTTDDGASVSAVTLDGNAITDSDFTDGITVPSLVVGDNAIIVTVTAEDTSSTQTYTVTVTRTNNAPTASDGSVTTDEDTAHTFAADEFNFADPDGDALASVKVVTLPTAGGLALDGTAVTVDQAVPAAKIGDLVFTPEANANGMGYASFTFRVSDGMEESALAYAMTVNVTAVDDPATGGPTISGTAGVGQTLTAATTDIADVDGLTRPTYGYQWIRVDDDGTSNATDIAGETSDTYTPMDADVGKKIRVKVSFTDDAGGDEELTSDAYPSNGTIEVGGGICGRTAAVRDELVALITSVSNCAEVTDARLAAIRGSLFLGSRSITTLAVGDFAGLTSVTHLNLAFNELTTLPAGVFAGLAALTELYLDFNDLTMLPDSAFAGLPALTTLKLEDNELTALPSDVFDGLATLEILNLAKNGLTTLPSDVFDGLATLETLDLSVNELEHAARRGVRRAGRADHAGPEGQRAGNAARRGVRRAGRADHAEPEGQSREALLARGGGPAR